MPKTVITEAGYWMVDTDFGQPRYASDEAADLLLNAGFHFIEDPRTGDDDTAVPPFVEIPDPRVAASAAPESVEHVEEEKPVSELEEEQAPESAAESAPEEAAESPEQEAAEEAPEEASELSESEEPGEESSEPGEEPAQ